MTTTKTGSSGRLRWLCAFVFCCSIATAGPLRAQDTSPGGSADDTALAAASDKVATGVDGVASQTNDTVPSQPNDNNAPSQPSDNSGPSQAVLSPATTAPAERDVSERTLLPNFMHDQKDLWLFPLKFSHENHWLPTIVVVGGTAALLATDAHDAPYFRQTRTFNDFNGAFASNITMSEVLIAPASFYIVGLLDKDPYARKTGLLAGEAVADVTVLSAVIKAVTRQTRPQAIPPYGNFSDTFFNAKGDPFSSGFPSGHTISAFAVATVIAHRYGKQHRWLPFVAYGAAALIGFSRVSTQAHFPSEVFLGAALGYAVAQFDVLHAPAFGLGH